MTQEQFSSGCQFGEHAEPFLWHGSGNDDIDIAIMQLVNLASDNLVLAKAAAEFINACVCDAQPSGQGTCLCGEPATINGAWCKTCFPDTGR